MNTPVFLDCRNGGAIGLTPCPGRFRAIEDDVALIAKAKLAMVVSLIETVEQPEVISSLPKLLAQHGIDWAHFPISDFGTPTAAADAVWPALAHKVHDRLNKGARVLVHCWGGLGRSGMIALRILTERGEPADEALRRLRVVRPGAIETGAQLAWARLGDCMPGQSRIR